jgi:hypothetical protein
MSKPFKLSVIRLKEPIEVDGNKVPYIVSCSISEDRLREVMEGYGDEVMEDIENCCQYETLVFYARAFIAGDCACPSCLHQVTGMYPDTMHHVINDLDAAGWIEVIDQGEVN